MWNSIEVCQFLPRSTSKSNKKVNPLLTSHVSSTRSQIELPICPYFISTEFEADFNELFGEYICIASRKERLEFLHELLYGRLEDVQETEVGALWEDLDYETAEEVLRSADNPHVLVHPKSIPCKTFPPAYVEPEDETLYKGLPSVSRTSGWLARLFGFGRIQDDPHHEEAEYLYTYVRGYNKHRTPGWQVCFQGLKYCYGRVTGAVWAVIKFVFPDLRTGPEIPDIALTLPSPQGSTTDLFVSWVTDEREQYDYASATRRIKDPVHEAYAAVNKLIYDEYDKDKDQSESEVDQVSRPGQKQTKK